MTKQQQTLMRFDPATGWGNPYPSHAQQWRKFNGTLAWLFNPWTGERRGAGDVGDDTFGLLILPPGEPVYAAGVAPAPAPRCPTCGGAGWLRRWGTGERIDCASNGGDPVAVAGVKEGGNDAA